MLTTSTDPTQPNYIRPELVAVQSSLTLMDDLMAGPERMWERSGHYIRKWKHEAVEVYDIRRKCEPCFGGLGRTLSAATGMLFAKEPAMAWNGMERQGAALWDNIDNAGTKGSVFAKRFSDRAIRDGLGILLVDFPPAPADVVVTAANETALNLRPQWAIYTRAQGINWFAEALQNRQQLVALTLGEFATVRVEFGIKLAQRFRDLRLVLTPDGWQATWVLRELVEEGPEKGTFRVVGSGVFRNRAGQVADFLPVAIAYTGATEAAMTAALPLLTVGYANLAHWRYATNLTFNREVCGFEQLVITGELQSDPSLPEGAKPSVKVGPLVYIHLQAGGTAEWIGPTGAGLEQLEKGKHEKMVEMDQQGLGFLVTNKTVDKTATEAHLESHARLSTLATAGVGIQDGINQAWVITGWYEGVPADQVPVMTINTEFESNAMDAGTMLAYAKLVEAGFSKRQALEALQAGGRVSPDADLDELEMEWESELAAKAEQQRADRELAAATTGGNGDTAQGRAA